MNPPEVLCGKRLERKGRVGLQGKSGIKIFLLKARTDSGTVFSNLYSNTIH